MSNPFTGLSVLIVDGRSLSAADMSNRLTSLGARVHVVNNTAAAIMMTRAKKLDAAIIGHQTEDNSKALRKALDEYEVPYIRCVSPQGEDHLNYEKIFSLAVHLAA